MAVVSTRDHCPSWAEQKRRGQDREKDRSRGHSQVQDPGLAHPCSHSDKREGAESWRRSPARWSCGLLCREVWRQGKPTQESFSGCQCLSCLLGGSADSSHGKADSPPPPHREFLGKHHCVTPMYKAPEEREWFLQLYLSLRFPEAESTHGTHLCLQASVAEWVETECIEFSRDWLP